MMDLQRIAAVTNGKLLGDNVTVHGVTTDSRQECTERLFVALQGPNFDGHDYLHQAHQAGAQAALVSHEVVELVCGLSQVVVDDTLSALAVTARQWRNDYRIPVVAVTGSAGKTTVKELLGAVLSVDAVGVVTKGNLNNEIGVPLTLTRLKAKHCFAVIEMGMSNLGEIERLSVMAEPTIAIINNAAPAHLEGLGSLAAVATAKGEIVSGLADDGVLIINQDDEFFDYWRDLAGCRKIVGFGLQSQADVRCEYRYENGRAVLDVSYFDEQFVLNLPLLGKHNVMNALAVIAAAREIGLTAENIQAGFDSYQPLSNRSGVIQLGQLTLIDDSYNANPASMQAAIDLMLIEQEQRQQLLQQTVRTVLVLGDMAELGEQAAQLHCQVGRYAADKVDQLMLVGAYADDYAVGFDHADKIAEKFQQRDSLAVALLKSIKQDNSPVVILVKGSRSAAMEEVVKKIQTALLDKTEEHSVETQ